MRLRVCVRVCAQGEGVQHIAMFTSDIFRTMRLMRGTGQWGGFTFMDPPAQAYYASARRRVGDALTEEQYKQVCE